MLNDYGHMPSSSGEEVFFMLGEANDGVSQTRGA